MNPIHFDMAIHLAITSKDNMTMVVRLPPGWSVRRVILSKSWKEWSSFDSKHQKRQRRKRGIPKRRPCAIKKNIHRERAMHLRVGRAVAGRILAKSLFFFVLVTVSSRSWNRSRGKWVIKSESRWHDAGLGRCELGPRSSWSVEQSRWRYQTRGRVPVRT